MKKNILFYKTGLLCRHQTEPNTIMALTVNRGTNGSLYFAPETGPREGGRRGEEVKQRERERETVCVCVRVWMVKGYYFKRAGLRLKRWGFTEGRGLSNY